MIHYHPVGWALGEGSRVLVDYKPALEYLRRRVSGNISALLGGVVAASALGASAVQADTAYLLGYVGRVHIQQIFAYRKGRK